MKILEPPSDAQALVQRDAFQLLLARGGAIGLNDLRSTAGLRARLAGRSHQAHPMDGRSSCISPAAVRTSTTQFSSGGTRTS